MQDHRQAQREAIRAEAARRHITIEQRGQCYLLHAPGIDLMTADLSALSLTDLQPFTPKTEKQAHG